MPHPARPTVTLHDVAAAAGVSVATASRVLGMSSRAVAPEYEQRVLAAATALRYTADASARSMRAGSASLALVADDLATPSIGLVVAAIERQARASGAFVLVSATGGEPARQLETIRQVRALRPRALVLTSSRIDADALDGRLLAELTAYERAGGRVVVVGDTDLPFHSISFDNRGAGQLLGRYMADSGHRRVAILAGPPEHVAFSARTDGLVEALRSRGVEAIRTIHCAGTRQGGQDGVRRLAEDLAGTDAVLAVNDVVAIGALTALRAAAVTVPAELSVTGFDDIPLAVDVTPRLTTVALPLAYAGTEAARLALGEATAITRITVQGALVVRDSTTVRV